MKIYSISSPPPCSQPPAYPMYSFSTLHCFLLISCAWLVLPEIILYADLLLSFLFLSVTPSRQEAPLRCKPPLPLYHYSGPCLEGEQVHHRSLSTLVGWTWTWMDGQMLNSRRCSLCKKRKHSLVPGLVFCFCLFICKRCFLPTQALPPTFNQCNNDIAKLCTEKNDVVQSLSRVQLFVTPSTAACQASLSFTVSWNLLKLCPLSRWILQARILEWVALPFSRGSSWPRDPTQVSYIASRFFTVWASETFTENDIMILCCLFSFSSPRNIHHLVIAIYITKQQQSLPSWSILPSVQFSCSVVSDSLRPRRLQHARLPCPSSTLGACSDSCPSSYWCHPIISTSVVPFFSRLQSFPASGSFQMSQFFASGGQRVFSLAKHLQGTVQPSEGVC